MIFSLYRRLKSIVENEFGDIILESEIFFSHSGRARKLRINLVDQTFIDIWYSVDGEYSFHWEQRGIRDALYRHDNAPHSKWADTKTFPKHCHDTTENTVHESHLSDNPEKAVREFMEIVKERLFKLKARSK